MGMFGQHHVCLFYALLMEELYMLLVTIVSDEWLYSSVRIQQ